MLVALTIGLVAFANAAPALAAKRPKPTPKPAVVSLAAAPRSLPARGGSVVLTVRVRHATTCSFQGQRVAFAALGAPRTVPCGSGRASVTMPVAANPGRSLATLHYVVRAHGTKGRSVTKGVSVTEAPRPPALVAAQASPAPASVGAPYALTLTASGGTGPYTWTVVSGTLPAGLALAPGGAISGTPTAPGLTSFTVQLADSGSPRQVVTVPLSILVTAPLDTQLPLTDGDSANWSGYQVNGGPFTAAIGTFTIPNVSASPTPTSTAEWVGIGGAATGDNSIVQAGAEEDYDVSTGTAKLYTWWETYPAPSQPAPVTISAGDKVTVAVYQVSGATWELTIANDTTGQSWSIQQQYTGPDESAEWIVEAPTDPTSNNVLTLGDYAPPVTFTGLGAVGNQTSLTGDIMQDTNGNTISIPSSLDGNGFTVAFGTSPPGAP